LDRQDIECLMKYKMKLTEDEKRETWKSIGTFEIVGELHCYYFRRTKPKKTEWQLRWSKYYYPENMILNWFEEMYWRYGDE